MEKTNIRKTFKTAGIIFGIMTLLCGVVYTGVVTGLAQILFPSDAAGNMIEVNGVTYGSELLAQYFDDEEHMWGRIMTLDYETYTNSEGSIVTYAVGTNLDPESEEYAQLVEERTTRIQEAHPEMAGVAIPVDLLTCSGSGLDPHISVKAAEYQLKRLARTNSYSETYVQTLIDACTTHKVLGIFGNEIVNVLRVNLLIDQILTLD